MRILRGIQPVAKVTVVFLFALSLATIFTLLSPRAAHAEGFLYGTVRCVLQTVLTAGCQPASGATPTLAPTPAPSSPAPSNSPAHSPTPTQQANSARTSTQQSTHHYEPLPQPDTTVPAFFGGEVAGSAQLAATQRLDESKYLAYFNMYSEYAMRHAQGGGEVVQTGAEGWRIAGVPWYWWALGLGVVVASGVVFRRYYLRNSSTLSQRG